MLARSRPKDEEQLTCEAGVEGCLPDKDRQTSEWEVASRVEGYLLAGQWLESTDVCLTNTGQSVKRLEWNDA